jgi:hypothetical protein
LGRIIKALILGWIGKKIYDRTVGDKTDSAADSKRAKTSHVARRKRAAKRVAGKPERRAA